MKHSDPRFPVGERWTARAPGGTEDVDRAAAMLRAVPDPSPLTAAQLDRVEDNLAAPATRPAWRRLDVMLPLVALAAIFGALTWRSLGSSSNAGPQEASGAGLAPAVLTGRHEAVSPSSPSPSVDVAKTVAAASSIVEPGAGSGAGDAAERGVAPRAPARERRHGTRAPAQVIPGETPAVAPPSSTDTQPAPPEETELAAETRLLGAAMRSLRHGRDPAAALARLDEYRARFPHGTLRPEAELVRVDTLLALGRRGAALVVLEGLDLSRTARARELRVLRGELLSGAGRCTAAVLDFAQVFEGGDALEERARHGRATCRARAGDWEGARADLRDYLEHFPDGQFAAAARSRLEAN